MGYNYIYITYTSDITDIGKILKDIECKKPDISTYTDAENSSLTSILGRSQSFMTVVAHSSGSGRFLPKKGRLRRAVMVLETGEEVPFKPFTVDEKDIFVEQFSVKLDSHNLANLTGYNPYLMSLVANLSSIDKAVEVLHRAVTGYVSGILVKDLDGYQGVLSNLDECRRYLYYACNDLELPSQELRSYYRSWLHSVMLTYVCSPPW